MNGDIGSGKVQRGFNSGFLDQAFDMYLESSLQNIAHTSSTTTIDIFASGGGRQGGSDESWGLDNLQVSITETRTGAPEPGTSFLLGTALCALGPARRLRK